MEHAIVKVGGARILGTVVKRNKKTTIVDIDPFNFSVTQMLSMYELGYTMSQFKKDMEALGVTGPGRTKRHNSKHSVVFI